jgi:hypothetical protein
MMQVMSNSPPVRTFYATALVTAGWNQPVVPGGWRTPSGKRAIVMAKAVPETDNAQALTIKSSLLEYTEDAAAATGLVQFNTDEQSATRATELSADQFAALQKAADNHDGVEIMNQQAVTTQSGRHSEIQTVDLHCSIRRKILNRPGDRRYPNDCLRWTIGADDDFRPSELPGSDSTTLKKAPLGGGKAGEVHPDCRFRADNWRNFAMRCAGH